MDKFFNNFIKVLILIGFIAFLTTSIAGYCSLLFGVSVFKHHADDGLLTILGILLALLGVGGGAIYFWIYEKINKKIRELAEHEKNATYAETQLSLSYIFWFLYARDRENKEFWLFLNKALDSSRMAFDAIHNLDKKQYKDIICGVKNNLGYYLAEKQNLKKQADQKGIDITDRNISIKIKDEILELIESGDLPPHGRFSNINELKETCAWITYCFADGNEKEKEKAHQIIWGLREHFSTETFLSLKKQYGIN